MATAKTACRSGSACRQLGSMWPHVQAVLDVVHGVGHVVGPVHDLGLEAGAGAGGVLADPVEDGAVVVVDAELPGLGVGGVGAAGPGVLGGRVEGCSGEVEADGAFGGEPFGLDAGEEPQGLGVALEAAAVFREFVEGLFAVVAERGWPRSWERQAASTRSGSQPRAAPSSRPTWAHSREWVRRVRGLASQTEELPGVTTWVFPASLLSAAECRMRARSRWKAVRPGRLSGSRAQRSVDCRSYGMTRQ